MFNRMCQAITSAGRVIIQNSMKFIDDLMNKKNC